MRRSYVKIPNPSVLKRKRTVLCGFLLCLLMWEGACNRIFAEEVLYLAVELNRKTIAEVIEGREREGEVYVRTQEIAKILESEVPANAEEWSLVGRLGALFPARFEFASRSQALLVEGRGRLLIEQRWERERLQKYLSLGSGENLPEVPLDYKLYGLPAVDVAASYEKNGNERFSYSVAGVSEGLYGLTRLQAIGSDEKLDSLRVSWERVQPDWSLRLGDVFSPPVDLIARGEAGRGYLFSTFPIDRGSKFDTETIQGDLQPGWEVELYRKGTLLNFKKDDGTGRFVFDDIPLLIGDNDITLKFYGPQGQVRETKRRVRIGTHMVPEGRVWASVGMIEQGETLLLGRDSLTRDDIRDLRVTGDVYAGLTSNLTLAASFASLSIPNEKKQLFTKIGLRGAYFGASERLDLIADIDGGLGLQLGVQRRLLGLDAQYSHVEFFDLVTESERELKRRDTIRLDKWFGWFSAGVTANRETNTRGRTFYELAGRTSGSVQGVLLTNRLVANIDGEKIVRGSLLASGRPIRDLLLRGTLDYGIKPVSELLRVSGTADYRIDEDLRTRFTASRSVDGSSDYAVSSGVFWDVKKAALGLTGSHSSSEAFRVVASVTFSLSPSSSGSYEAASKPATNIGRVDVRVFIDKNEDGIFNSGDEPLKGVRLLRGGGQTTNDQGLATLKRPPYRLTAIQVDEKSLQDPFWVPGPAFNVRPHPGQPVVVDVPVWETGEVEAVSEPGALVELMKDNRVIDSKYSEFDGFVVFEKLRYGTYSVRSGDRLANIQIDPKHPVRAAQWE